MEPQDLLDAVNSLQDSVEELSSRSNTRDEIVERVLLESRRTTLNRFFILMTLAGFILDIVITVFLYDTVKNVDSNAKSVADLEHRTSNQVLCPLYKAISGSFSLNPVPAGASPELIAFRQAAQKTIQDGYIALGCS